MKRLSLYSLIALGAIVSVALAGPVSAPASTVVAHAPYPVSSGPFLAGRRVLWADSHCADRYMCPVLPDDYHEEPELSIFRSALPGRPPREVLRSDEGPYYQVSSSHIAQSTIYGGGGDGENASDDVSIALRVGPIGGRLRVLYDCETTYKRLDRHLLLGGAILIYTKDPCSRDGGRLVTLDLRTGAERLLGSAIDAPEALAGRYRYFRRDGLQLEDGPGGLSRGATGWAVVVGDRHPR